MKLDFDYATVSRKDFKDPLRSLNKLKLIN